MAEPILYRFLRPILTFLFKLVFHPHIINKEQIPNASKSVIVCNHTNYLDCILLLSSTKRTVHFLAKEELVLGPLGIVFKKIGVIPVKRKTKDPEALIKAIDYLNKNKLIGIFPEGTINKTDNKIIPFKIGAVKMAHKTDSPIVVGVITGKYKIFGKGITITFSEPYKIKNDNLEEENQFLMNKIENMLERR